MPSAKDVIDQQFIEMRARCLSLAADLDRIQRAPGGAALLASDARMAQLRQAIRVLIADTPAPASVPAERARHVLEAFSDHSAPPPAPPASTSTTAVKKNRKKS